MRRTESLRLEHKTNDVSPMPIIAGHVVQDSPIIVMRASHAVDPTNTIQDHPLGTLSVQYSSTVQYQLATHRIPDSRQNILCCGFEKQA